MDNREADSQCASGFARSLGEPAAEADKVEKSVRQVGLTSQRHRDTT
jgi:hypothetical protein